MPMINAQYSPVTGPPAGCGGSARFWISAGATGAVSKTVRATITDRASTGRFTDEFLWQDGKAERRLQKAGDDSKHGGAASFSFTTGSSTIGAPYGGKKTTESKRNGHRTAAEARWGLDWAGGCGTAGGGAAGRGRRTPSRDRGRRREGAPRIPGTLPRTLAPHGRAPPLERGSHP